MSGHAGRQRSPLQHMLASRLSARTRTTGPQGHAGGGAVESAVPAESGQNIAAVNASSLRTMVNGRRAACQRRLAITEVGHTELQFQTVKPRYSSMSVEYMPVPQPSWLF
jgi:hypothetical protein